MEKINFINNSQPAINDTNLNKLQDNVEDLIKTEQTTSDEDTYSCNYINGIVESGSNTNGNYIKYIDGTLICTKVVSGTYQCNQSDGSIYKTQDINLGDYAQTFTQLPTISGSVGGTSFCWLGLIGGSSQSVSSPGIAVLLRPTSSGLSAKINIIAIGKWK